MTILDQGFKAVARSLRDFGYPDATPEMVREAHQKWKAGEEPEGIIEMMSVGQFKDYPQIFGEPV